MAESFRLERRFAADPQELWTAWTTPESLARWYGPQPGPCQVDALDLRVGGAYRNVMGEHVDEGVFHAVEAPRRLRFGTPDEAFVVDAAFKPDGDGTAMTLTMHGTDPAQDAHMRGAWNAAFDKLDALLQA